MLVTAKYQTLIGDLKKSATHPSRSKWTPLHVAAIAAFALLSLLLLGKLMLNVPSHAQNGPPCIPATQCFSSGLSPGYMAMNASRRAVVSSLYDNTYSLPLRVLGYSLDQAKVSARRIVIYIPGYVNERELCEVKAAGWELRPVERIPPPKEGTADQFRDQYTKLAIFDMTDLDSLVYLDADTIVTRNFDELWQLPTTFAAVPDIYLDNRGFTLGINAGVLFVRPQKNVLKDMLSRANSLQYEPSQAEQSFLNAYYFDSMHRLPYRYNGNLAVKQANRDMWQTIRPSMAIIHYTLYKPHKNAEDFQRGQLFEEEFKYWWQMRRKMEAETHTWAPALLRC